MPRIVYVNGEYVNEKDAKVSVFDRGFLFADGVYEVTTVLDGELIDNDAHLARLRRSLGELDMAEPCPPEKITEIQRALVQKNSLSEGLVYLQVTRGAADRDFAYPKDAEPTLVLFTQEKSIADNPTAKTGIAVITTPDIRWARRDIKTVGLLAPSMAKMEAVNAGADDAWMVDGDGFVTEGSSNNAYIITQDGAIVTRALSNAILHGITRRAVLALAQEADMRIEERKFTVSEAENAVEAFITSASSFVMPVVSIDGRQVGSGKPGPMTNRLRQLYIDMARKSARPAA